MKETTRRRKPDAAEQPGPEIKDRIFDAGLKLFGQKGYAGVSVREICRLAEASAPTVYYYYDSKRGLYEAILKESMSSQRDRLREALEENGDCLVRLRRILEAWLGVGGRPVARELRLFYLREAIGLGSDLYRSLGEDTDRALRHALRSVIQDGIHAGIFRPLRAEIVALTIIGIMNTFMRRVALGARLSPDEGLQQVMDSLLFGLVATDARPELLKAAGRTSDSYVPK